MKNEYRFVSSLLEQRCDQAYLLFFKGGLYLSEGSYVKGLPKEVIITDLSNPLSDPFKTKGGPLARQDWKNIKSGWVVYVPENIVIDKPICIVDLNPLARSDTSSQADPLSLNLLVAGSHSQVCLYQICQSESASKESSAQRSHTEIWAEDQSHVQHYKLHAEQAWASSYSETFIHQATRSQVESTYIAVGGHQISEKLHVFLQGPHAHYQWSGLSLAVGKQQLKTHLLVDHTQDDCISHQLHKSIVGGQAESIFDSKVIVREKTVNNESKQNCRSLLLSSRASAYNNPQLEIYADAVQCQHGATVGQMDEDALFYLRTRGLDIAHAQQLLMEAFIDEVLHTVSNTLVREDFKQQIQYEGALHDHL